MYAIIWKGVVRCTRYNPACEYVVLCIYVNNKHIHMGYCNAILPRYHNTHSAYRVVQHTTRCP